MPAAPLYTPEFVERGYNNRAAVPDHPLTLAKYKELSKAAVRDLHAALDLRYGGGPKETLDLFLPAATPRGTFAFVHGGYWRTLDKADFSFVAAPLVARGYAVAVINYDLCPAVAIDAIVDESRRAVLWLAREGPQHGTAGPLVVGGHSAGGHLVAMLFATDWRARGLPASPIHAGVSLSGVHDLEPLVLSSMNADLRLDRSAARNVSPVHHAPQTNAPLLIVAGADETTEFLRQSQLMFDAWPSNRPAGRAAPWFIADRDHFTVVLDYADPESELSRATLALFPEPA